MTEIIIQGLCGRMGRALVEKIAQRTDCHVFAGVDERADTVGGLTAYPSLEALPEIPPQAVVIDFSGPEGAVAAAQWCARHGVGCVVCSTGLNEMQEAALEEASGTTALFRSANMSMGVNVLLELARRATRLLGGTFDIEIVEKHHRNKLDAPSGTALMIADVINEEADHRYRYVYDRHAVRQKRGDAELGISSVRGGGIVGEHEVLFCGPEEVLTISHSAQSRAVFADGAIQAALFLAECEPGYYTMADLLRRALP